MRLVSKLLIGLFIGTTISISDSYAHFNLELVTEKFSSIFNRSIYINPSDSQLNFPIPENLKKHLSAEGHYHEWLQEKPISANRMNLNNLYLASFERTNDGIRLHFQTKSKPRKHYYYDFSDLRLFNDLWINENMGLYFLTFPRIAINSYYKGKFEHQDRETVRRFGQWLDQKLPARFLSVNSSNTLDSITIDSWGIVYVSYKANDDLFFGTSNKTYRYKIGSIATYNNMVNDNYPMFRIGDDIELAYRGTKNLVDHVEKWEKSCAAYFIPDNGS